MLPSYRNHPVSRMDCTKAMSPRMFWALPSSTNMRASSAMGMLMRGVTFCVANHDAIWSPLSRDCPMTGVTPCVAGAVVTGVVVPPDGVGACGCDVPWAARPAGRASAMAAAMITG